ncbi:DUF952 domain-containing protein [Nocardioides caeni]|uniref:DUF952 domain-containing protein n=1 Tax=Nocardioides caeni TaxID=574700 RepID=UPI001930FBCA|nr:DUF952 domain-containing protein [Nocardioides caeni]
MATIFHLALASDWAEAEVSGSYTISTRGRSLAEEGFIHASRADQWTGVRDRFYADVTEPLVLLHIDTDLLDVPVVEEPASPGGSETFPHIYGRLPAAAVVKAIPLPPAPAAAPVAPAPVADPAPAAAAARPGESFTRLYFREIFFNAAILMLAITVSVLGMVVGGTADDRTGPGIGGVAGLALGLVAARWLYRRRHAARTAA